MTRKAPFSELATFLLVLSAAPRLPDTGGKHPPTVTNISKPPGLGEKAMQPGGPGSHCRGHFGQPISSIPTAQH